MVIAYPQQVSSSKFHSLDIIFINISYPYFLGCDWRTDVCPRSSNAIGPESGGLQTCDLTRSYNLLTCLYACVRAELKLPRFVRACGVRACGDNHLEFRNFTYLL